MQLGETTEGNPFVMLNFTGETGEKASVIFEDADDIAAMIHVFTHGQEMMRTALDIGFRAAVEHHGEPDVVPEWNEAALGRLLDGITDNDNDNDQEI